MHATALPGNAAGSTNTMPNGVGYARPERLDAIHNDFIPHPSQFPIRFRRRSVLPWKNPEPAICAGDVGLSFHASDYLPAGTRIEMEIPLRGVTQRFTGTVVLVREVAGGYQIGVWFATPDDASRVRIVEKICHTECYLRSRDGRLPH